MTNREPLTLRALQDPSDIDETWRLSLLRQDAELTAVRDLHQLLTALGVLTVEAAIEEIADLQRRRRVLSKMVQNTSMDDFEWQEYQRKRGK